MGTDSCSLLELSHARILLWSLALDATGWTTSPDTGGDLPWQLLPAPLDWSSGGGTSGENLTSVSSRLSAPARGWLGPPFPAHTTRSRLPPCSRGSETGCAQAESPGCTWHEVPSRLPAQPSRLTSAHPPRRFARPYSCAGSVRTTREGGGASGFQAQRQALACTLGCTPVSRNHLFLQQEEGNQRGRERRPRSPTIFRTKLAA